MFERESLLSDEEPSIAIETRTGKPIANRIASEPGERELRVRAAIRERYGKNWKSRKPACGVYNCAGVAWASRRTAIYDDAAWDLIFAEDGYRKLPPGEPPVPGDLVVYREKDIGYLHVGVIVESEERLGNMVIPKVLSNWDDASGEYLHWYNDAAFYHEKDYVVTVEYWTDRPSPGG
jgi:hypothetical protein